MFADFLNAVANEKNLYISPFIIPFLHLFFYKFQSVIQRNYRIFAIFQISTVLLYIFILCHLYNDEYLINLGGWSAIFGIELLINWNNFLIFFACFIVISYVSFRDFLKKTDLANHSSRNVLYSILLFGIYGMCVTNDLFNTYVWIEVVFTSIIGLILHNRKEMLFESIMQYIIMSIIASSFILIGIGIIYRSIGLFNLHKMYIDSYSNIGLLFIISGFWIKISVFPYMFWFQKLYSTLNISIFVIVLSINSKIHLYSLYKILKSFGLMSNSMLCIIAIVIFFITMLFSTIASIFCVSSVQSKLHNAIDSNKYVNDQLKKILIYSTMQHTSFCYLCFYFARECHIVLYIFQYIVITAFFVFLQRLEHETNISFEFPSGSSAKIRNFSQITCKVVLFFHLFAIPISTTFFTKIYMLEQIFIFGGSFLPIAITLTVLMSNCIIGMNLFKIMSQKN